MSDWFRSLGAFGMAFAAVVVFTLGVADAIVPSDGVTPRTSDAARPGDGSTPAPTVAAPATTVGGSLTVSGDRDGELVFERETIQDRYGLVGPDGRILFQGGEPVTVARIQYDGLEFFLDPGDCTVTPGERHDPTGVAGADIRCEEIDDVRDKGTISLEGRVGVAASLFGLRGDLPETGGTLTLGEELITIEAAHFTLPTGGFPGAGSFVGRLVDSEAATVVVFEYDVLTHALSVAEVQYGDDVAPAQACAVDQRDVGVLDPHTRVVELTLRCDGLAVPSLGDVSLEGSVIAEVSEPPR